LAPAEQSAVGGHCASPRGAASHTRQAPPPTSQHRGRRRQGAGRQSRITLRTRPARPTSLASLSVRSWRPRAGRPTRRSFRAACEEAVVKRRNGGSPPKWRAAVWR